MFKSYEEIFKNLRDMQDQFWKASMQSAPDFGFTRDLNAWQKQTLENMNTWAEKAVKQSLDLQREWLGQWSERATSKNIKPKLFADLSAEAHNSMQSWLDNQSQLWDQWLKVLRASSSQGTVPSFDEWQKATQDSIGRQMALMQEWFALVDFKKLSNKEIAKLSEQIAKSMQKAVETQQQLWGHWFKELGSTAVGGEPTAGAPAAERPARRRKIAITTKETPSEGAASSSDDLKQISGIGPALEKQLNDHGIFTLRQIAALTDDEIASLEENIIRFPGRIKREQWVEQAKQLTS